MSDPSAKLKESVNPTDSTSQPRYQRGWTALEKGDYGKRWCASTILRQSTRNVKWCRKNASPTTRRTVIDIDATTLNTMAVMVNTIIVLFGLIHAANNGE